MLFLKTKEPKVSTTILVKKLGLLNIRQFSEVLKMINVTKQRRFIIDVIIKYYINLVSFCNLPITVAKQLIFSTYWVLIYFMCFLICNFFFFVENDLQQQNRDQKLIRFKMRLAEMIGTVNQFTLFRFHNNANKQHTCSLIFRHIP